MISRIDWKLSLARLVTIVFAALLTMIAVVSPAVAQVPPSGYLQTCRNVQFDGFTLSAMCQGAGGQLTCAADVVVSGGCFVQAA